VLRQLPTTLGDRDTALQKHSTQLFDQRRPLSNKLVAHARQRLHVELCLIFLLDNRMVVRVAASTSSFCVFT
jgi:hypothetical protein